jgi:hypothetical protein
VRSPIVIRPVAISAPPEVTATGSSVSWQVKTGYTGPLTASVRGLVAATETPWTILDDPDDNFDVNDPTGTFSLDVVVPAGSTLRAGVYEDAITPSGTDLDLYVYRDGVLVGGESDGDSNEDANIVNNGSTGTYTVYVHGFATNGPSATGTLFTWVLGTANAGNTTLSGVGPATVGTQTHTATFSGLTAGRRYLGRVDYSNGTSALAQTYLSVRP